MIGCIVNNSISHPPHPRRAVPANLPPGAFLFSFFGAGWVKILIFTTFFTFSALICFGDSDSDLLLKIKDLRLKSNAHGKFVSQLLANDTRFEPIEVPELSIENKETPAISPSEPLDLTEIDLPAVVEETSLNIEPPEKISPSVVEQEEVHSNPDFSDPIINRDSSPYVDNKPTYEGLYAPKHPLRRIGYYFGPFVGPVFPDDSAVKTSGPSYQYDSKGGVVGGFRLGNDFGSARIEAEYAFLTHEIESILDSGDVNIHNLKSRLILEKSLGKRADFRGGIGLGIAFINLDLGGKEYDGVGFSYDFLLGWSYRVMDNWSMNIDYRHYLTAAHKNYDRLQGHIVELSVGFDL